MRRRVTASLVLTAVLVAGCSSSEGETSASDTAAPDTTAAEAAPTTTTVAATDAPTTQVTTTVAATTTVPECSRPATPGRQVRDLVVDGISRRAIVYVPQGFTGAPAPLVLTLHGSGSSAAEQLQSSRLESVADSTGAVIVAPDAGVTKQVGDEGPTGGVWNVPGVPYVDGSEVDPNAPDDVSFLDQLVDQLEQEFCFTRVAVSGTSGGGRMASALGCFSDRFDVIAPVAGLRISDPCTPKRPVEVIAFHGTEDVVNPYLGGGPASWGPMTVPEAAAAWAALQGCSAEPTEESVSTSVTRAEWSDCEAGASVQLFTVAGGGHNWPGGEDAAAARPEFAAVVGVTSQEISAGELILAALTAG